MGDEPGRCQGASACLYDWPLLWIRSLARFQEAKQGEVDRLARRTAGLRVGAAVVGEAAVA
jgi:hypothetical protein